MKYINECVFQEHGAGNPGRNSREKERRRRRNQRRKNAKGEADVKSENTQKDQNKAMETESSQTQDSESLKTQPEVPHTQDNLQKGENSGEQPQKDPKMVQAQTQTRKLKGLDKVTQTEVVTQKNQETQTDFPVPKQDEGKGEKTQPATEKAAEVQEDQKKHTPGPKLQGYSSVQTPSEQNPEGGASSEPAKEQRSEKESKPKQENPSAEGSGGASQTEEGAKQKSYAKAVAGVGGSDKQSTVAATNTAEKTSQSTR